MAEAVFSQIVKEKSLDKFFYVDSAATSDYHIGDKPDARSVAKCKEHGVPVNHRGRQVTKGDFNKFDYIFCMDESNLRDLNAIKPDGCKASVSLFGEFDPKGDRIIKDPYYGGDSGFERNFQQVQRCSIAFLSSLGHE